MRTGAAPACIAAALVLCTGAFGPSDRRTLEPSHPRTLAPSHPGTLAPSDLQSDLDAIFADPIFARALVGARVESLTSGEVLYQLNSNKLVMPASNMKLVTMSVAAERLGWGFTYRTTLDCSGEIAGGTLDGDLLVTGSGDPTIGSPDMRPAAIFGEWADALIRAGIHRVNGRLIGNARVFDRQGLGNGWSWDDLNDDYAAPSGGLSYDENTVTIEVRPAAGAGQPAAISATVGHPFDIASDVTTGPGGSRAEVTLTHGLGSRQVAVHGSVPAGGAPVTRRIAVDQPLRFFLGALEAALASRGITVAGGIADIDDLPPTPASVSYRPVASHESWPLAVIGGYFMKVSQNFYAETLLKTLASAHGEPGTIANGRRLVFETVAAWGVPSDALVMDDGSGLSRYDYVTADAIVAVLKHMWRDEALRGPFASLLPVGGHDGTLGSRMKNTVLDARVEAKTGTIRNVRSLSGYLETTSGDRVVFSIIANHFTATSAAVDAVVERALARIAAR